MSWTDLISMVLSLSAIIVSCLTSLIVVLPHPYIHAICETKNQCTLLLIINNGFSSGLLFTDYGIVYRKRWKRYFVPIKSLDFQPRIHEEYKKIFWNGYFLRQIAPQETVFLVLSQQDICEKLKDVEKQQNIKKVRFYLDTSIPWGNKRTKRLLSQPQEIKELLKSHENHPN